MNNSSNSTSGEVISNEGVDSPVTDEDLRRWRNDWTASNSNNV